MNPLHHNRLRVALAFVWATGLMIAPLDGQEPDRQRRVTEGPVTLTSSIDRSIARVADPIEWTLQVEAPAGSRVGWPAFPTQVDALEIRASEERDAIPLPGDQGPDNRIWTRSFLIETLETGAQRLPAAEVQVDVPDPEEPAGRRTLTLRAEPLSISVESSLPEDADPMQFRDIKDVVDVEAPSSAASVWIVWIIGGGVIAALLVLAAGLIWFGRRTRSPVVWARKELARLRQLPVDAAADRQHRFAEVVDLIRQLLAARFRPEIGAQTAEEWNACAEANDLFDRETRTQVADLLKQHDLSRFARTGIDAPQLETAFDAAERVIESVSTLPAASPADAAVRDTVEMRSSV